MKTSYENFLLEIGEDGIAVFTANRPKAKNAMNLACWHEFLTFLREAQTEPSIRIIVLTGMGDSFIAGADIKEFMGLPGTAALFAESTEVVHLLERGQKPVVGAVNGAAFGGGFEVAIASDIRIVSETAILGLPETGLGVIPGMGGTQRLCKLIGTGRAKEVIMAGRNLKGPECVGLGLAMKCVPEEQVLPEAMKVARKMLKKGPYALSLVKRCVSLAYSTDDATGLLLENLGFSALMGGDEMNEGTHAFLEKRLPNF